MQRVEQLRPLSRQHHLGLNLGLKASQCPDDTDKNTIKTQWQQLYDYIHDNLTSHFGIEENFLVKPLLNDHASNAQVKVCGEKLIEQHQYLYQLLNNSHPTIQDLRTLGKALYDHIRFEEREVFPLAQQLLTKEQLDIIYQHMQERVK